MSTWQILSDECNNFRWELCYQNSETSPVDEESLQNHDSFIKHHVSDSRLPSMRDLLFKECPKLVKSGSSANGSSPIFHTGLRKSVGMKGSSITKTMTHFGDVDYTDAGGCSTVYENGAGGTPSYQMFRTGSGKPVTLKQSSIARALTLLDDEDCTADVGGAKHLENGSGGVRSSTMFQTRSGKSISMNIASFENEVSVNGDRSSTEADGHVKANSMLGFDENDSCHNIQGLENVRKQSTVNVLKSWQKKSCLETFSSVTNYDTNSATLVPRDTISSRACVRESESVGASNPNFMQLNADYSVIKSAPIKFHTAGGRSISVSSDALDRARGLLGQPDFDSLLNERNEPDPVFSVMRSGTFDGPFDKKKDLSASLPQKNSKGKNFISPLRSKFMSPNLHLGNNLIKKFEVADDKPHLQKESSLQCVSSSINQGGRSSIVPLADISNTISTVSADKKNTVTEKRMLGRISVSPFKRPRNSKFTTPINGVPFVSNGHSTLSTKNFCCKRGLSTRYPFLIHRVYVKEYFGCPPSLHVTDNLPDHIRLMNPDRAEYYMFHEKFDSEYMGTEVFRQLLVQSGASPQYAHKEWVSNHFKWIVWKLACYQRCYPFKKSVMFLTASNVFEELKYRYEREVNYGHRSIIKKVLEGDATPSSMMVLCVSAIYSSCDLKAETLNQNGAKMNDTVKVELTDGWYSIDAFLDLVLVKHLKSGKIYLGQKLRIWGSCLCGWVGPVSPLEIPRVASLSLHVNGTYRAHWADKLGLCKDAGAPLAFRCIKNGGGLVPLTLVGIKRIYPILFMERLKNGGYIIRSEKMETAMMQLHNQRRSILVENLISELEGSAKDCHRYTDSDSEEGAQILKILETAAEPEFIMAEMSTEQLNSIATYQVKLEANKQSGIQKKIEKALDEAGLNNRDVTPFMKVKVVGLTSRSYRGDDYPREGIITTWNPTNKQNSELVEGQAYIVSGLVPLNSDSHTLCLQARCSSTRWRALFPSAIKHYKPFFSPRESVSLSTLGDVPLSGEFDMAALIVYVGEVYTDDAQRKQKRQWVFVTDGSASKSQEFSTALLTISFCLPCTAEVIAPINHNLVGSIACFCNLIKRANDHINNLWVAEATENSTYSLNRDNSYFCHLKNAAMHAERWAKVSNSTIEKLKEKVVYIITSNDKV